jgi:AraC-like DNA-binding protein
MAEQPGISRAVMASATPLPQAAGAMLHWDDSSGVCGDVESHTFSASVRQPSFQATEPPVTAHRATPYWTTGQIGRVPTIPPQAMAWEKEAALLTFSLPPVLLVATVRTVLPGATGELVWLPWQKQTASPFPTVHPVLLVHAPYASRQAERVTLVPALHAHDPLLHHMALVLQAAIEGEGEAGRLYAAVLADALVGHFLTRYAVSRSPLGQATGGLALAKLQRVITYIEGHLEQALSLTTLAAVAQTSPAHFARLFKQATGRTPHQYVITCRMAYAKRLLVETDMPLSQIGPQVGCADQSHFTALFRKHVSMTPQAYRNHHTEGGQARRSGADRPRADCSLLPGSLSIGSKRTAATRHADERSALPMRTFSA